MADWQQTLRTFALPLFTLYGFSLMTLFIFTWKKRRELGSRTLPFLVITVVYLGWATAGVVYLTQVVQKKMEEKLLGYAPTYAYVFGIMGHERLDEHTSAEDPSYLRLIEMEKAWLAVNPFISDIYTMKKKADGSLYLMVDSETDYNHSGKIDDDREQRTDIGEVYESDLQSLGEAFKGKLVFTPHVVTDRWGSWVSAYAPIPKANGTVSGILGIDFSAEVYFAEQLRMVWMSGSFFSLLFAFLLFLTHSKMKEEAAHQALVDSLQISEEAKNTKARFLATVSHEIRTPLNGILGAGELMAHADLTPPERTRYLQIITSCTQQLIELVNDVLDFSKLESSKMTLEKIPCRIRDIVDSCLGAIEFKARENGIRMELNGAELLDQHILADPTRLKQILLNFLSNAVKFTRNGTVKIACRVDTNRGPQPFLTFLVTDTGPGISAEGQARLFQSFSQVDASTTRQYGGTGLGLSISKSLAELMGGSIGVDSKVGRGSTFWVSIPLETAQAAPVAVASAKIPVPAQWDLDILIVDDNEVNRVVLAQFLKRLGLSCRTAVDGRDALAKVRERVCDLIFLDGHMPVMDGFETAAALRKDFSSQQIKIIAVTASTGDDDRQRFLSAGADLFLTKPLHQQQLASALEGLYGAGRRRAA